MKFVYNHGNNCETVGTKTILSCLAQGTWVTRVQRVCQCLKSAFSTLGRVWQRGLTKPSNTFFCQGGVIPREWLYSIDFVLIHALDYRRSHRQNWYPVQPYETDHLCLLSGFVLLLVSRLSSIQLSSTLGHFQQICQQSY